MRRCAAASFFRILVRAVINFGALIGSLFPPLLPFWPLSIMPHRTAIAGQVSGMFRVLLYRSGKRFRGRSSDWYPGPVAQMDRAAVS